MVVAGDQPQREGGGQHDGRKPEPAAPLEPAHRGHGEQQRHPRRGFAPANRRTSSPAPAGGTPTRAAARPGAAPNRSRWSAGGSTASWAPRSGPSSAGCAAAAAPSTPSAGSSSSVRMSRKRENVQPAIASSRCAPPSQSQRWSCSPTTRTMASARSTITDSIRAHRDGVPVGAARAASSPSGMVSHPWVTSPRARSRSAETSTYVRESPPRSTNEASSSSCLAGEGPGEYLADGRRRVPATQPRSRSRASGPRRRMSTGGAALAGARCATAGWSSLPLARRGRFDDDDHGDGRVGQVQPSGQDLAGPRREVVLGGRARQPPAVGDRLPSLVLHGDHEAGVVAGHRRDDPLPGQQRLGGVEVDPDAEGLDEPGAAAGDLEQPVGRRRPRSPVRSSVDGAPEREVGRASARSRA